MLVGIRSGEFCRSLYVASPRRRSRMTSSDHLSPTRSSVLATAQGDRRNPGASASGLLRFPRDLVTCIMKVSLLHFLVTCKLQVTQKAGANSCLTPSYLMSTNPNF